MTHKEATAPGDILFKTGELRLPKTIDTAIRMAEKSGLCLTRQSSIERCEQVRDAIADRLQQRGLGAEIRPGRSGLTCGLYVKREGA